MRRAGRHRSTLSMCIQTELVSRQGLKVLVSSLFFFVSPSPTCRTNNLFVPEPLKRCEHSDLPHFFLFCFIRGRRIDAKVKIWSIAPILDADNDQDPNARRHLCTTSNHNGMARVFVYNILPAARICLADAHGNNYNSYLFFFSGS